jgi:hypothetical protein
MKYYKIKGDTPLIIKGNISPSMAKTYGEYYTNVYSIKEITQEQALAYKTYRIPIVNV